MTGFLSETGTDSFHIHSYGRRSDPVRDHLQQAQTRLRLRRDIEGSACLTGICDPHRAVVVRACVVDIPSDAVGQANKRIVGSALNIVAVSRTLRETIEVVA